MNGKVEYEVIAYGHDGEELETRKFDIPNVASFRAECFIQDPIVSEVRIIKKVTTKC